jgi:ribosomal peptide maturation radical SAM protein 1
MVFSKYVFPEHWEQNRDKFKEYFVKKTSQNKDIQKKFNFESYVKKTDDFFSWLIDNIDWKSYDIIGFTLNYGQLLPSLAVAKKIKEIDNNKKILFGGSRTVGELGIKTLEVFDYVDYIISGDGEEALFLLASRYHNYKEVPNLIFREGNKVIWNKSELTMDINSLPILTYDSFFNELNHSSSDIKQYFSYYGRLPIEISRGCWWNKCTFCNQKILHPCYRQKDIDKIIEEIQWLSDKYHILAFQLIGETMLKTDYRVFLEKIKHLRRDFSFVVELRAGQLTSEDYTLLKDAGFTLVQTGIETFSRHYLKKMNKGARIIDNIAALKFCKENGIINGYNVIIKYPNEEKIDFEQTKQTIQLFRQYLDPPQISRLRVGFGSSIYNNPEEFNIEKLEYTDIDRLMFPKKILEKKISFFYTFKRKKNYEDNDWLQLFEKWKQEREQREIEGIKRKTAIDTLVFYFIDGEIFGKIYDKRDTDNIRIFTLDELERLIFLSCVDIISFQDLRKKFPQIPEYQLAAIMHTFEKKGIVFREDDYYLSLPLRYNLVVGQQPKIKTQQIVQTSGILRTL